MNGKPSDIVSPNVSQPDRSGALWNDYKHDQLQQIRTTVDHAAILQSRAARRIREAQVALAAVAAPKAGDLPEQHSIDRFHALERMLDEIAFYPAHDKRKESAGYARVHHQMTGADDKRCLVCGVRNSTLHDPDQNPFGAIQLETHHHTIEWALANAIDEKKFNQHIRPGLLRLAQQRAQQQGLDPIYTEFDQDYANDMPIARIKEWIDHSADNLWVLCDVHHRHKYVGIHAITYPIWGPQDVVSEDLVEKEIEVAKKSGTDKSKAGGGGG
jgi:hypothetical protein